MSTIIERLGAYRRLAGAGLALVAMACGSSSSGTGRAATRCTSEAQCLNGQTCTNNVCTGAETCTSPSDCKNGFTCGGEGKCVPVGGMSGSPGSGGASGGGGGSVNSGGLPGGAPSGGTGGDCSPDNGTCASNSVCCNYPAAAHCVNFGTGSGTCAPLCASNADCTTGCCAELTTNGQPNGSKACAPSTICSSGTGGTGGAGGGGAGGSGGCVGDIETCAANGDCCGFPEQNRCFDPGSGIGPVCAIVCATPSGPNGVVCNSGCCLALSSGYSVCAPAASCATTP